MTCRAGRQDWPRIVAHPVMSVESIDALARVFGLSWHAYRAPSGVRWALEVRIRRPNRSRRWLRWWER